METSGMTEAEAALLRRMITESGKMWSEVRDRTSREGNNSVVICTRPGRAFYLDRAENYPNAIDFMDGWCVVEQSLYEHDAEYFYAEFGHHWPYWIGAVVKGQPLRAFIKNGRHEGWSISLGPSE